MSPRAWWRQASDETRQAAMAFTTLGYCLGLAVATLIAVTS